MRLRKKKSNAGRPKMLPEEKQQYKRIATYPETHARIVANAEKANLKLIDYMEKVIPKK